MIFNFFFLLKYSKYSNYPYNNKFFICIKLLKELIEVKKYPKKNESEII